MSLKCSARREDPQIGIWLWLYLILRRLELGCNKKGYSPLIHLLLLAGVATLLHCYRIVYLICLMKIADVRLFCTIEEQDHRLNPNLVLFTTLKQLFKSKLDVYCPSFSFFSSAFFFLCVQVCKFNTQLYRVEIFTLLSRFHVLSISKKQNNSLIENTEQNSTDNTKKKQHGYCISITIVASI